jgi:putative transposase
LGQQNPTTVIAWRNAWERFIPFLAFPPELRRIIYTTNAIESLELPTAQIIKNRGHFPNDQAAVKLLWLAIGNIEDKRARERQKFYDDPLKTGDRSRNKRLVEGARTNGWKQALTRPGPDYPERINPYL